MVKSLVNLYNNFKIFYNLIIKTIFVYSIQTGTQNLVLFTPEPVTVSFCTWGGGHIDGVSPGLGCIG